MDKNFLKNLYTHLAQLTARYPITLDAAGLQRLNGTLSVIVTGVGAASACRGAIKWIEYR